MALKVLVAILFVISLAAGEIKNKGWWKNTVFYQVYPRSFMDGNNDGVGDLQGITKKLDHFVESGIGGIWLSPIYTSPMVDFGYDISDFRDVDDTYGSMQDLEELLSKAKKLGIKVILDFVPNHTSDKHYWFEQSYKGIGKYKDYFVWRKGKANNTEPPNNWISVFTGPAWTYNPIRDLWYLHQFEYRQPDLNFTNPNVRQEMEEVLEFWLSKGIDGFRIDSALFFYENDEFLDEPRTNLPGIDSNTPDLYLDHKYTRNDIRDYELVRSWRELIDKWADAHNEDEKVLMTEAYTTWDDSTKFYEYGSHIPFNFFLITDVTNTSTPSELKNVIENWMVRMPSNALANWVTGNHDRRRLVTRYPGRVNQMTMLAMVLPGIAVTYYGEEIAMEDKLDISWEDTKDPQACLTNPERYLAVSRDPSRTPFQWDDSKNAGFSNASSIWLPINQNYKELNLAKQKLQRQSHYKLYQTLTNLRKTSNALKNGTLDVKVLNDEKVLAVIRQVSDENVILLINFSNNSTEKVDVNKLLPKPASKATIVVASVDSDFKWGSSINTADVKIPPKNTIVLTANIKEKEGKEECPS